MRVKVRAHAGARVARSEAREDGLHIWVSCPPVDGKANVEIAAALAEMHGVPRSAVTLLSGHTSKHKIFDVDAPGR